MATGTYKDLKASIVLLLNRDDLTDDVISQVEAVIRRFQRAFFWISPTTITIPTVQGQVFYNVPDNYVDITYLRLLNSNTWQWMVLTDYVNLLSWDVNIPPTKSTPFFWSPFDQQFRIYPAPDAQGYTLEMTGNQKIPIPPNDDASNFWTTNASDLIRFATVAQIYATRIGNPDRAAVYERVAEEHRISLIRESTAKTTSSVIQAHW